MRHACAAIARCCCKRSRAVRPTKPKRSGWGFTASAMACHAWAGTARCGSYRLRLVWRLRIWANSGSLRQTGRAPGGCAPRGAGRAPPPRRHLRERARCTARRPRSRAAMSSSSRKVPWLIMICRDWGSVSGSRRVRSQRSTISFGVPRSTSHDCRLCECGARIA